MGRWRAYNSCNNYSAISSDTKTDNSMVISMRLPVNNGKCLKRMTSRHGWTPCDTSARLVEEGLRRSEFAFIDFRATAGRLLQYAAGLHYDRTRITLPRVGFFTGCLFELKGIRLTVISPESPPPITLPPAPVLFKQFGRH
jgi:hypothetical protein